MKPLLRGWSHLVSFFFAVLAVAVLVSHAPTSTAKLTSLIYGITLCTLFGVSALYHRPKWSPNARQWMRRMDHSAIFLLIAGTMTPFSIAMSPENGRLLLFMGWGGALLGILRALFWIKAPKPFVALSYIALGWAPIWFGRDLYLAAGPVASAWLAAGGVLYSLGALCYALKKPNLWPEVFGYHELFHAFVVIAAAFQYVGISQIVSRATA